MIIITTVLMTEIIKLNNRQYILDKKSKFDLSGSNYKTASVLGEKLVWIHSRIDPFNKLFQSENCIMRLCLIFVFAFQFYSVSESLSFSFQDIAKSIADAAVGNFKEIPDAIPSLDKVFEGGKNLILGLPVQMGISVLNAICSAALSSKTVSPRVSPDINKMNYLLKIRNQTISVPLNEPKKLWSLKEFNPKLPLVMMITGWKFNINNTNSDEIYAAYRCRGNINFAVKIS